MAPLVIALKQDPRFQTLVTLTAQHREMLDQVLALFAITADYDLNLMKPGQTLSYLTASILNELKPILTTESPDMIWFMAIPPRPLPPPCRLFMNRFRLAMSKPVCGLKISILPTRRK